MRHTTEPPKKDTPVKATATSLQLLEVLMELEGATISELDDHVDLSKSTIHNHLETLEILGFIVKDGWVYRVSQQTSKLGAHARRQNPLFEHGRDEVRRLAKVSGLVANIVVLENNHAICVYTATGKQDHDEVVYVGEKLPLHCTAAGKALLSTFDEEEAEALLDQIDYPEYTDNTLTSMDSLLDELQSIRSKGLAFDRQEWKPNLRSIGTALTGPEDELLGAISVISNAQSMTGKRFQQDVPGLVISSSNAIYNTIRSEE
ncbi:IclR family transcriptional regulator [Natronococcus occultus]|uniref:Transcriptional regulator n=1 Tax=Natronococcus occultus SP4 TaxID=694430 RepID=L0JYA2_9EURY|nr:IclR family transcriptional regulator [Natronococcus occultus]AGB37099.1 transcriptional regulator [Natronococcus occultus SP4]